MEKITFSYNWNGKLNCDCFTTLRLSSRLNENEIVEVIDRGVSKGQARIIKKRRLNSIAEINDMMAFLDTGYNAEECRNIIKRMHPKITDWDKQSLYYYLIKYERPGKKT